jgi:hypothetical protein
MRLSGPQKRMILNARAYLMHVARAAQQGGDEPLCNALQQHAAGIFTTITAHEQRALFLTSTQDGQRRDNTLYFLPEPPEGQKT